MAPGPGSGQRGEGAGARARRGHGGEGEGRVVAAVVGGEGGLGLAGVRRVLGAGARVLGQVQVGE